MQFEAEFESAKAPDDVFAYLADWEHEPDWNPRAKSVRKASPGELKPGTVYRSDFRGFGEVEELLETLSPPDEIAVRLDARQATATLTISLVPRGGVTRGKLTLEMKPKGAMRLLGPLMLPLMMPMHLRDMARGLERVLG